MATHCKDSIPSHLNSYHPSYTFSPLYLTGRSGWTTHLPFAFDLLPQLQPRLLVELGTWYGDSFFTFCQSIAHHSLPTLCYAVDHWQGDPQAGISDAEQFHQVSRYNHENYGSFSYLIRTDFDSAATQFSDDSIDLLHIDGFHSYEAVSGDFNTWYPKVMEGGVILFHDIKVRSDASHPDFGVWKFWDELKKSHTTFEFNHGHGLGILIKGSNPSMEAWFRLVAAPPFKSYYASAGQHLMTRIEVQQLQEAATKFNEERERAKLALATVTDDLNTLLRKKEQTNHASEADLQKAHSILNKVSDYSVEAVNHLVGLRKRLFVRPRIHKEVVNQLLRGAKTPNLSSIQDLSSQTKLYLDKIDRVLTTMEELRNRDWLGKISVRTKHLNEVRTLKDKAELACRKAGV